METEPENKDNQRIENNVMIQGKLELYCKMENKVSWNYILCITHYPILIICLMKMMADVM